MLGEQYWPFVTLTELVGTCIACDSGLAAPFATDICAMGGNAQQSGLDQAG
jgi:hypothetical protein